MTLKIFHTSDLHLGMKFAGYEGEVRDALVEARFQCLARLVRIANEQKCDLFVVAGDLFERVDVAKKDVVRAAQALSQFEGHLVTVLPGNHDYVSPDDSGLWGTFREQGRDNLLALLKRQPLDLTDYGMDAVLYPCPCTAKHSSENATDWVNDERINSDKRHHIGIAHGSLEGISPDFEDAYYSMTRQALESAPVRIWMLGHTHIRYPDKPGTQDRIFYGGTPEPDGFDCDHRGVAWIHQMGDDGSVRSTPMTTGAYYFRHDDIGVERAEDADTIVKRYAAEENRKLLLKLKLMGRVPDDVYAQISWIQQQVEKLVFWLKVDTSQVVRRITERDINATFTEGSFPHRLLRALARDEKDFEALQEAHRLIMEVKK